MPAHMSRREAHLFLSWYSCWKSLPCAVPKNHRFPSLSYLPMQTKHSLVSGLLSFETPPTVNILRHDLRAIWRSYKVIRIAERLGYTAIQALLDNQRLQPYLGELSQYSKRDVKRLLTQMIFYPSESVSERMHRFGLQQAPYVGVHVRSGEDFGESDHRFDLVKSNLTTASLQILRCVTSAFQNNTLPLNSTSDRVLDMYVASDSKTLKVLMAQHAKRFNVRVHSLSSTAMHLAVNRREGVRSVEGWREMFRNVFVDLFMLSKSVALFTTGSGFSDAAWSLSENTPFFRIELDKRNPDANCNLKRIYER